MLYLSLDFETYIPLELERFPFLRFFKILYIRDKKVSFSEIIQRLLEVYDKHKENQ